MSEENNINNEIQEEEMGGDDVVLEADEDNAEGGVQNTIKKLRERLKKAEADKQEYLTGWQTTKADYINSRKRDEETQRTLAKFAQAELVEELLPVLDSFDVALNHAKATDTIPKEWNDGMRQVYNQFLTILLGRGVKQINPLGEPFDPNLHEAIGMVDTDKQSEDNKVLDVVQKGYTLHDKLIRTARVRVGHLTS